MTEKPFDGTVSMQYGFMDDSVIHDYQLTLPTNVSSFSLNPTTNFSIFGLNYFLISYIGIFISTMQICLRHSLVYW